MDKKIANYFRNVLISAKQKKIDFLDDENNSQKISLNEFKNGQVSEKIYENFVKNQKEKNDSIDVIIIPKVENVDYEQGNQKENPVKQMTGILYVPAKLTKNGEFKIENLNQNLPWIPREFLEPMIEPELSKGHIKKVDEFLKNSQYDIEKIEEWEEYINFIKEFYEKVSNNDEALENEVFDEDIYVIKDNRINPSFHVEALYENIENSNDEKKLYENFVRPSKINESKKLISNNDLEKMKKHKGQMGGEYPLSVSQREALNHFSELNDGEILAVSGPPGTGKTTLLQSIVADIFVNSAIKKENPKK